MSLSYEFDCDVETVMGLLTDPQYLVDRNLALGELEADCDVDEEGDALVINVRRKVVRELPGFLAKMFDPEQVMQMTETWQPDDEGGWAGNYTMEFEGKPVSIAADFELYATDTGCCYSIQHRAKAKIPLIGGKVEKYIMGQTASGCDDEIGYLQEHLASL